MAMNHFVVFGIVATVTLSLWNVDCSPKLRRTRRYFPNTIPDSSITGYTQLPVSGHHPVTGHGFIPGVDPYGQPATGHSYIHGQAATGHSFINGQPATGHGFIHGMDPYAVGSDASSGFSSDASYGTPVYTHGHFPPQSIPTTSVSSSPPPSSTYYTTVNSNGQREYIIHGRRVSESELAQSGLNVEYPYGTGMENSNQNNNPISEPTFYPIYRNTVVHSSPEVTTRIPEYNYNQYIPSTTESTNEVQDKANRGSSIRGTAWRPQGEVRVVTTRRPVVNRPVVNSAGVGYDGIVNLLIQGRLNVNTRVNGGTYLHNIATSGNERLARLLVHNGADLTVRNSQGKSPSNIARDKGFTQLALILQENVAKKACDVYTNVPILLNNNRIIGGRQATSRAEFPWMAALGYLDLYLRVNYNCGGTLISDKFVLTAAHCVKDNERPVRVRLGEMYLNTTEGALTSAYHEIEEIIRHPEYSISKKVNDIALIKLVTPVFFSEFIRPACLQTQLRDENPNVKLTITGWGKTSARGLSRPNALQKAIINTVSWTNCNATFNRLSTFQNGLEPCHYCAADPNGVSDSCQGDSGGPLQIVHPNLNMSTIVGVVSTGLPCGGSGPGIYTRVAHFIDWIESYVWPNGQIAKPQLNEYS